MISKKLLKEIFGDKCKGNRLKNNIVYFQLMVLPCEYVDREINIHELAHKCKEWANDINITIDSGYDGDICEATVFINETRGKKFFHAPTETEAIFKACEWVLEQKTTP